jgi:hypothetical protein
MDFVPFIPGLKNRPGIVNPYRFYGLSHLRPRGFPLHFEEPTNHTWQPWTFGEKHCPIPDGVESLTIQQGLLQKHPDTTEGSSSERFNNPSFAR